LEQATRPPDEAERQPQPEERYCPRCGAPYEPLQEYCLECGTRLPVNRGVVGYLASAWQRRVPWYPGDWIWPVLLGFCIAAVATAVVLVLQPSGSHSAATVVATSGRVSVGPGQTPETVPSTGVGVTVPQPTIGNTSTLPKPPGEPSTTTPTAPTPPAARQLVSWPTGRSGYTVILESLPKTGGRSAAIARARQALAGHLPQVGVLDSGGYSSLHPGYYAVFSGIYASFAQASSHVSAARAAGFRAAYARQITT
jgi:hypothetical protein